MRGILWGAVGVWLGASACEDGEEQLLCDRFEDRAADCGVVDFDYAGCTTELSVCNKPDELALQGYLDCVGIDPDVEDYVCGRTELSETSQETLERLIRCGTRVTQLETECQLAFNTVSEIPTNTANTSSPTSSPL